MSTLFELLEKYWRYLQLISLAHYFTTLAGVILIAWLVFGGINWFLVVLIAAVVNPVSVGALIVLVRLWSYDRAVRSSLYRPDPKPRLVRAYRRLGRTNKVQNFLGRVTLGAAVPLAQLLLVGVTWLRTSVINVNARSSASLDRARESLVVHYDLLHAIGRFGADAGGAPDARDSRFEAVVKTMGRSKRSSETLEQVLYATYLDGAGVLSTLEGTFRSHLAIMLPTDLRTGLYELIASLDVPPDLYGWLGGRVVQLALELTLTGGRVAEAELRTWCAETTVALQAVREDERSFEELKYERRAWLIDHLTVAI